MPLIFFSQFLFSRQPELQLATPIQKFTGSKFRISYFREISMCVRVCVCVCHGREKRENLHHAKISHYRVDIIESVDSISRDEPDSPLTQYITNAGISRARYTITHFKHHHRVLRLISNGISVYIRSLYSSSLRMHRAK